jgi:hypothetical protein
MMACTVQALIPKINNFTEKTQYSNNVWTGYAFNISL